MARYKVYIEEKQPESREKFNKNYAENILAEIRHMKHLLDIMERNIQGKLTERDAIELKKNAESWNKDIAKLGEMINSIDMNIVALAEDKAVPVVESIISEKRNISSDKDILKKEYIQQDLVEDNDEESHGEIFIFIENIKECIDSFLGKVDAYESDEELYEESEVEYPAPQDYGSEEYDYPTKAKAKVACKEAVKSAIEGIFKEYETERDNIISCAEDYFSGLKELFQEFISEFLESYDEYASLECEGQVQEYVMNKKAELFSEKELQNEIEQGRLEEKIQALKNKIFDIPIKGILDVKEYFAMCTYDEDDEYYCFDMENACEKMYDAMQAFLEDAQISYPREVEEVYMNSARAFCEMLKDRLAKL